MGICWSESTSLRWATVLTVGIPDEDVLEGSIAIGCVAAAEDSGLNNGLHCV